MKMKLKTLSHVYLHRTKVNQRRDRLGFYSVITPGAKTTTSAWRRQGSKETLKHLSVAKQATRELEGDFSQGHVVIG